MISLLLTIKTIDSMRKVCFLMGIAAFALLAPSGVKAGNDKNAETIYSVTDAASSGSSAIIESHGFENTGYGRPVGGECRYNDRG